MGIFSAEIENWDLARELYETRSDRMAVLLETYRREGRLNDAAGFLFFIAYVRISDLATARSIAKAWGGQMPQSPLSVTWARRITQIFSFCEAWNLHFVVAVIQRLVCWWTGPVNVQALFSDMYLSLFTKYEDALTSSVTLYCHLRNLSPADRPRVLWMYGFVASVNGHFDFGRIQIQKGVSMWDIFKDAPCFKYWQFEGLTVLGTAKYHCGSNVEAIAIHERVNGIFANPGLFPFGYIFNYSMQVRSLLAEHDFEAIRSKFTILKRLLGRQFDSRFAIRAHVYSAIQYAIEGNSQSAFNELGFAESISDKSSTNLELYYYKGQKSRVYIIEGLVSKAIDCVREAIAGYESTMIDGYYVVECYFAAIRCFIVANSIYPMTRERRREMDREARTYLRRLKSLTRFSPVIHQRAKAYERIYRLSSSAEQEQILAVAHTYQKVLGKDLNELARALKAPQELLLSERAKDEALRQASLELDRTERLSGLLRKLSQTDNNKTAVLQEALKFMSQVLSNSVCEILDSVGAEAPASEIFEGIIIQELATARIRLTLKIESRRDNYYLSGVIDDEQISFRRDLLSVLSLFRQIVVSRLNEIDEIQNAADQERLLAHAEVADQVAHDIRSPLSALNMVSSTLTEIPEAHRLLMGRAINSINDIANGLLQTSRKLRGHSQPAPEFNVPSVHLISALLDTIVSEKRLQYRDRYGLVIESHFENSLGLFANVYPEELRRIISNLIDNAVESLNDRGSVHVDVTARAGRIWVTVKDNGCGIPPEVLPRLMVRGATFGKSNGNGLGLYYCKEKVERLGGALTISSKVGRGTEVTIDLPKASSPSWSIESIVPENFEAVFVVDDDSSIHDTWKEKFSGPLWRRETTKLHHFLNGREFTLALRASHYDRSQSLFLIDYELIGERETGLDLIESLGLANNAVLVTSRFEEKAVVDRVQSLGLKLLPKNLICDLQIHTENSASEMRELEL